MATKIITILRALMSGHYRNQTELAEALKVRQPTVSRWFNGSEPKLAHRNKILALAGKHSIIKLGDEADEFTVQIVGYVGAGGQVLYDAGQGPFGETEMPPKEATSATVALIVRGDSMAPQLEDGWEVYYNDRHETPTDACFGKLCVIGLNDGRVLVKKLIPGTSPNKFHLYSHNAAPLLDQPVSWAARVIWIRQT